MDAPNWQQWIHLPVAAAITVAAITLHAFNPGDFAVLAAYYVGAAMHTTIAWGTAIRQSRLERQRFREEVEQETLPAAEKRILAGVDTRLAALEVRLKPPPYPAFPVIPDYSARFNAIEADFKALPDFEELRSGISQDVEGLKSRVEERLVSFNDKAATITARLDLTDQKLAGAIDAALKREMPPLFER